MLKPITAIIVLLLVVASLLVSGCTSSTNSNQAAGSASSVATKTANPTTNTTKSASITPKPAPPIVPTPTPIPPSPTPTPNPTYQVIVTETDIRALSQTWTAKILVNGVQLTQSQLTGQVIWTVNGQPALGHVGNGTLTILIDNGELKSAPFHKGVNIINAEYLGVNGYTTEMWTD